MGVRVLPVLFTIAVLGGGSLFAQQEEQMTRGLFESRMQLVEQSSELSDSIKNEILEVYRAGLADLELAALYEQRRNALQEAFGQMPAEIDSLRIIVEQQQAAGPPPLPAIDEEVSDEEIEEMLNQEVAALYTAENRLKDLEAALEEELQRPALDRERIATIRLLLTELDRQRDAPRLERLPLLAEATRWANRTKKMALEAEAALLNQQLLASRSKAELIRNQQKATQLEIGDKQRRLEQLRSALRNRGERKMERAAAEASRFLDSDTLWPSPLRRLAGANLELMAVRQDQLAMLDSVDRIYAQYRSLPSELTNAFSSAQRKLELDAIRAPLGRVIREERGRFPEAKTLKQERRQMDQSIALVSLRLIELEEERLRMNDPEAYLKQQLVAAGVDSLDAAARDHFQALVASRRVLLDRTIGNDASLEQGLYTLSDLLEEVIQKTKEYDAFLDSRLLWVRSAPAFRQRDFAQFFGAIQPFLRPANWFRCAGGLLSGLWKAPWLLLSLLLVLFLIWRRSLLLNALAATGEPVRRVLQDSVGFSFQALGYSLLLALPLPLLLWIAGSSLATVPEEEAFCRGLSRALVNTSYLFFFLAFARILFLPDGLIERHAEWTRSQCKEASQAIGRLMAIGLPFYFLTTAFTSIPSSQGSGLGLLTFTGYTLSLSWFAYVFCHPGKGVIRHYLHKNHIREGFGWPHLLFVVAVVLPPLLAVAAWMGYIYTAVELYYILQQSVLLLVALWLISFLARRWLLIVQRKLEYEALQKKRAAMHTGPPTLAGETSEKESVDPRTELRGLDSDTRKLFSAVIMLAAVLGLASIWGQVVPALSVLEEVELWSQTTLVEGVEQVNSITLANLLKALLYGAGAYILVQNLPSLVNILLIKRGKASSGARYAISTLLKYSIGLIGILLVLAALGATTAQLGWAAAALSFGIGFGLQEIVANFISGLILLFERPVRIGDVVTIGEATGVVTAIQIRATTIRNWERQELLVPNKELITGRLINWTLTDTVIRVQVKVGVAYGSNVEKALALMEEVAGNNPRVMKDPAPFTWFERFGDSTLHLTLNAFINDVQMRMVVVTELNRAVDRVFKENDITIAFPQLDVHVRSEG